MTMKPATDRYLPLALQSVPPAASFVAYEEYEGHLVVIYKYPGVRKTNSVKVPL